MVATHLAIIQTSWNVVPVYAALAQTARTSFKILTVSGGALEIMQNARNTSSAFGTHGE